MNRRQFLIMVAALVLLVAAGAAMLLSERSAWKPGDARIGTRLVPELRIDDVAAIRIRESGATLTLTRGGEGWRAAERPDAAVDVGQVRELLLLLTALKIVQVETIAPVMKEKLRLVDPGDAPGAGAGTVLELNDVSGKALVRLLLGSVVMKPGESTGQYSGTPAGRRVLLDSEQGIVGVVSESLTQVSAKADPWIVVEPPKLAPEKSPARKN